MENIGFIGTGGSVSTVERDNTSFMISAKDGLALIDCPGSVLGKIKKLKFDPRDVSAILVTHVHPDHIYGLPSFVHGLMLDELDINLYGSEITVNFCRDLLQLFNLLDKKIKCRINFVSIDSGDMFDILPSLSCKAIKVPHNPSSLAYHFQDGEKKLLYSGDTPGYDPLFQEASGIDYLIHDCSAPLRFFKKYPQLYKMHTNSHDLGRLARQADVKCLIPCHFFGEIDFKISEIEEEIRQNYTEKLIIPEDYMLLPLK
jgi:ribonuclease BN (tRNA processing enzyme)